MNMNVDSEWLLRMAEKEEKAGGIVSVGGLVTDIAKAEQAKQTPCELAAELRDAANDIRLNMKPVRLLLLAAEAIERLSARRPEETPDPISPDLLSRIADFERTRAWWFASPSRDATDGMSLAYTRLYWALTNLPTPALGGRAMVCVDVLVYTFAGDGEVVRGRVVIEANQ